MMISGREILGDKDDRRRKDLIIKEKEVRRE
jgi:hypothetical protein